MAGDDEMNDDGTAASVVVFAAAVAVVVDDVVAFAAGASAPPFDDDVSVTAAYWWSRMEYYCENGSSSVMADEGVQIPDQMFSPMFAVVDGVDVVLQEQQLQLGLAAAAFALLLW